MEICCFGICSTGNLDTLLLWAAVSIGRMYLRVNQKVFNMVRMGIRQLYSNRELVVSGGLMGSDA
jgi:hypothetical protein